DGSLELTPVHQEPYPAPERFQPWETCMTMGQSWAYNPHETRWKEPAELVRNLVAVVSRGGNYLLNVGPTANGEFPPEAVARLQHIGRWMDAHQQAIYGTTYTPLQGLSWGQATRRGNYVYLHVFDWPNNGKLAIEQFPGQVKVTTVLNGQTLAFEQQGELLSIRLPDQAPDPDVAVLALEIDPAEAGWHAYSAPVKTTLAPAEYLRKQVIANAWINALLNGLIAFFSYRTRTQIPAAEAAVDILITVAIIAFLVSWIAIGGARGQLQKGNLDPIPAAPRGWKLPKGGAARALVVMAVCVLLYGGLLAAAIFLLSPAGFTNWAYIALKTIYTGGAAALAAALAIYSVLVEGPGSS
ncbi:MAG: alpha-L-fucosidase, partial [Anaerolineales bacterium]|nr:alpha-L-fucosidase [Anaerolineales bacterium]